MKYCADVARPIGPRPLSARVSLSSLTAVVTAGLLLTACGGSHPALSGRASSIQASSTRSLSPTRSGEAPVATKTATKTATKPATKTATSAPSTAASRSQATRSEGVQPTTAPATQTESRVQATSSRTAVRATVTQTSTQTSTQTQTSTPAQSASPTPVGSATPVAAESGGGGTPAWVWWLIAAAGLVLVLVVVAISMRHHRRRVWSQTFAQARNEVRWVAQTLVPSLALEPSPAQMMQGWQPGSARVMAVEDKLARLETSAPDPRRAAGVRALRDAVVSSRIRVNELVATSNPEVARAGLSRVAATLDTALTEVAPTDTHT